jgi:hypothetical protein
MCPAQNLNVRLCGSLRKTDALMPELRAEGNRRTGTCRHPHSLSSRFGLPGTSRIADCFGLLGTGHLRLLRASRHGASPIASGFSARGFSDCFGLLGMGHFRSLWASRHGALPIASGFSARGFSDCFGLLGTGILRLLRSPKRKLRETAFLIHEPLVPWSIFQGNRYRSPGLRPRVPRSSAAPQRNNLPSRIRLRWKTTILRALRLAFIGKQTRPSTQQN